MGERALRLLVDVLPRDVVKTLEKYVETLESAGKEFTSAIDLLNNVRIGEARTVFTRTIELLDRLGALKTTVDEGISSLSLDPGFKEELLTLMVLLDDVADSVKEAAREFTVIPFLELPAPLRSSVLGLSEVVSKTISLLATATKMFTKGQYSDVEKAFAKILQLEEQADNLELESRRLMLELGDRVKPFALQLLTYHLISQLENASDRCAKVAERLKLIALSWLS